MMHCAACRTYPQLGAQPEWISGIKNCHQAEATNLQNIEFLCFEFLRLVVLLSDTVRCTDLHHFLGICATFLGNLRPFGEKFTPIYTTWGLGAETPVNTRKLPA